MQKLYNLSFYSTVNSVCNPLNIVIYGSNLVRAISLYFHRVHTGGGGGGGGGGTLSTAGISL